jgi:hypothetical protein
MCSVVQSPTISTVYVRRQSPRFASRVEASGKMGGPQSARARNLPPRLLLELRVVPNLANPKERQQVTLPA